MNLHLATRLVRNFLAFAGPAAIPAVLLVVLGALSEGLSLAMIVPVVAFVTDTGSASTGVFQTHLCAWGRLCSPDQRLIGVLAGFVLALTLRAFVLAARDRAINGLQARYIETRRMDLVRTLARSRWQDLATLRHARVTQVLAAEIPRLGTALAMLLAIAVAAVMLLAQLALLALLSWPLAALFFAVAALAIVAAIPSLRRARALAIENRHSTMMLTNLSGQLLGGLKLALAQNMQRPFIDEMQAASGAIARRQTDYDRRQGRIRIAGSLAAALVVAAMVWTGLHSGTSSAALIAATAVFVRMLGPATGALRSLHQLAGVLPSYAAVEDLSARLGGLDRAEQSGDAGERLQGDIVFHDVGYAHPGGGSLAGIRLHLPQGSRIGITGPSGAGKTTFVDLLCGLLEPGSGTITVGVTRLEGQTLSRWRSSLAYVAQDSFLINDTVRRNLIWGIDGVTDEEIHRALGQVEAAGIIAALPRGLDEPVGERGIRLSGGERQRLALARALLRRPRLLILDEATNALDLAAERRILDRLSDLPDRPTVVIVAHRPEALSKCDQILNFAEGRLLG